MYAYGRALHTPIGQWDYRLCYKMSYAERIRARAALTWTWVPQRCALSSIDGARFSQWLGKRTILFWGDSLTAQHFYSLVLMLGRSVRTIRDLDPHGLVGSPTHRTASAAAFWGQAAHPCEYQGLGSEGGPYTEAVLAGGGRVVKVLGHIEMIAQLRSLSTGATASPPPWWRALWRTSDFIVFNPVSHHLRTIDGSFRTYASLVSLTLHQMQRHAKRGARLVLRTSNVGHASCGDRTRPLGSLEDAWRALGGWAWQPPGFTPSYYGAPRDGPDKYDWRAPALHEGEWAQQLASSPLSSRVAILK